MIIYLEEHGPDELYTVDSEDDDCPHCTDGSKLKRAGDDYLVCEDGCGGYFIIYED